MDEVRLTRAFAHGNVAAVHWSPVPPHEVLWISASIQDLLGFAPEEFVEGHVQYMPLIHPDDLERVRDEVRRQVGAGVTHFFHDDYRIQTARDGWKWIRDHTLIERHDDGSLRALLGYLVDVDEDHRRTTILEKQTERLSLAMKGARIGLWDWDPQNDSVSFDDGWARMLGHELDEIPARLDAWSSRVHPDDLPGAFEAIQRHIEGEVDHYEHVHRMRHADGRWIWILDRGQVVERDDEGRPLRFTGTHSDISAQKNAELEAQRANLAKSQFLARMSHEIRTPLNGVLGMLQLLASTSLDEQQLEYVDTIRESGETLQTIIDDVLDLSKVEAGEYEIDPRAFDVTKVLTSVHELYAERAAEKGLDYRLEIDPHVPPALHGDDHRIRQVLANLLSNALKFTDEGSVVVRVGSRDLDAGRSELVVEVVDTGPGIARPERIWDAYRQDSAATSRTHGGTGLGLAISRQLSIALGGSLELETQLDVGSTFVLRLPLAVTDLPSRDASEHVRTRAESLPRLRVLVAEDNRVNQMVIRGVLDRLGQDVDLVDNGHAAVDACRSVDFDLVLMDIHMPELGGLEAAAEILRTVPAERRPRIVAISADAFVSTHEDYATSGIVDAVNKPFRIDDIARVIEETAEAGSTSVAEPPPDPATSPAWPND